MDKDIKTRHVVRDIKTAARWTGAANAARAAAIKTRDAAYGTVPAATREQGDANGNEAAEGGEIAAKGTEAGVGAIRANRAHARKAQTERRDRSQPRAAPRGSGRECASGSAVRRIGASRAGRTQSR